VAAEAPEALRGWPRCGENPVPASRADRRPGHRRTLGNRDTTDSPSRCPRDLPNTSETRYKTGRLSGSEQRAQSAPPSRRSTCCWRTRPAITTELTVVDHRTPSADPLTPGYVGTGCGNGRTDRWRTEDWTDRDGLRVQGWWCRHDGSGSLRVVLADYHTVDWEGLATLLGLLPCGVEVVGVAEDGLVALRLVGIAAAGLAAGYLRNAPWHGVVPPAWYVPNIHAPRSSSSPLCGLRSCRRVAGRPRAPDARTRDAEAIARFRSNTPRRPTVHSRCDVQRRLVDAPPGIRPGPGRDSSRPGEAYRAGDRSPATDRRSLSKLRDRPKRRPCPASHGERRIVNHVFAKANLRGSGTAFAYPPAGLVDD